MDYSSEAGCEAARDLPRTMARIRRLVRENPNDRELQRLLHHLLTSLSSDKIDASSVRNVLLQMEERSKAARALAAASPATVPMKSFAYLGSASSTPCLTSAPPPAQTPADDEAPQAAAAALGGDADAVPMADAPAAATGSDPLPATPTVPMASVDGAMRRFEEQALSAIRQRGQREARQAQAEHEYALQQQRRQMEAQLSAADEARRAEQRRAETLALELNQAQTRLRGGQLSAASAL